MKPNNLTSKPILLTIVMLAWPTMLEQVLQVAVQYVDSAMVGRLGAHATAAVGATTTVSWLIGSSVSAVGIGFLAYIAKAWGAKRYEDARKAVSQALLAALACGIVFTVLPLSLAGKVPVWMNAAPDIREDASRYFFIIYTPMLLRCFTILFSTTLRATGDTRTPMLVNTGVNLVNVILNYLLIYGTHEATIAGITFTVPGAGLGVIGAAYATAVSIAAGGITMLVIICAHKDLSPLGRPLRPDWEVLQPCLRVAVPSACQRFATSFGYVAFASLINGLGTVPLAAHSIANTVESLFYVPGYGMQAAAGALSGNTYGAGDKDRMRSLTRTLILLEICIMAFSGTMLFVYAEKLTRIFTISEETALLGAAVLRMVAVSEPMYGVSIILEGIFQGVGDTKGPFVYNVIGMWCVRILGTYIMVNMLGYGLQAAWACMIAHNVFLSIMFIIRYKRGVWNPLLEKRKGGAPI